MKLITQVACLLGALASSVAAAGEAGDRAIPGERTLTFAQRVAAQEALERVYYSHQNGDPSGFERAVPPEVLQDKVRSYLRKSAALESLWHTTITPQMLRAELSRMAAGTRMPDRLRELYRALGDDPVLVQETLARPALVDRLARKQYEAAPPHGKEISGSSPSWDEWWAVSQTRFDEGSVRTVALDGTLPEPAVVTATPGTTGAAVSTCSPDGFWIPMGSDNIPSPRLGATTVWTGSVMIVWGGRDERGPRDTGGIYDPAIDAWLPVSRLNAPAPREYHLAVWSGSRMIVWGGYATYTSSVMNTGGMYDPLTDTWTAMDDTSAPAARWGATAVWTGATMLIWGGAAANGASLDTGGSYDPASNAWTAITTTGAPAARANHTAIWTGTRMIVWGGGGSPALRNDGARYDPSADTWEALSSTGAPDPRASHAAVWTGTEMLVWGGYTGSATGYVANGGRYDPAADTWGAISASGAPAAAEGSSVVWIESGMYIWGGRLSNGAETNAGAIYDPGSDSWASLAASNAPAGRKGAAAIWTGSQVLIWGGSSFADGGRYDPAAGTWTPIAPHPIPPRLPGSPVWTGSVAIVWPTVGSGGHKYDPTTDTWTPISSAGAPSPPYYGFYSKSVWTGSRMIVWGPTGQPHPAPGVGGVYDPASDTWTTMSMAGSPPTRTGFTTVWTGSRMIVWGGWYGNDFATLSDGYSYDPQTNAWASIAGGLNPRANHSAVWTGSRMIVWGGISGDPVLWYPPLSDGGSYNPATNTWSPIASAGAPSARERHTAIWTGSRMIVWGGAYCGGFGCTPLASGGRYNPTNDTWAPVGTAGAPQPMGSHSAVWTGQRMIVYESPGVGGQYIPSTDTWLGVSPSDAPVDPPGAVWTGRAMIAGSNLFFPDVNADADGDGYTPCDGDCNDARYDIGPGAGELCNGVDDDCDGVIDPGGPLLCGDGLDCTVDLCGASRGCLNVAAPDGSSCSDGDSCTAADACLAGACMPGPARDGDGDAHGDPFCGGDDCDDSDPAVWHAPSQVAGLAAGAGLQTPFSWEDQGALAGPATAYDLFSGALSAPAQPDYQTGTCLMTGGPSFYDDTRSPAPSIVFWYLARARNGCGTGTWGSPGADAGIGGCP